MDSGAEWSVCFRRESSRLTARLVRQFGPRNLTLIEDAVQETFIRALKVWKTGGPPENIERWLSVVAKRIAVDKLRREKLYVSLPSEELAPTTSSEPAFDEDELSLFYFCCHPLLSPTSQIILTLREVAAFSTREIGRCLFMQEASVAQRLLRIKGTLRELDADSLAAPGELNSDSLLRVMYLMFTRGYSLQATTSEPGASSAQLCDEAIALCHRFSQTAAGQKPETFALLALMLFQSSRMAARVDTDGATLPFDRQTPGAWDARRVSLGLAAFAKSASGSRLTTYHVEAAIAAEYATCDPAQGPNWERILAHYDDLVEVNPSEVVQLNRAIVLGMVKGPGEALRVLDRLKAGGRLSNYHHLESARAFFLAKADMGTESALALTAALEVAYSESDRLLLQKRLGERMGA